MGTIRHKKTNNSEHLTVELNINLLKEDGVFVVYCPDLELSSHGDTVEEAKKNFTQVMDIFFEDVIARGTLDQVLEDCGWEKVTEDDTPRWIPPAIIARETLKYHIPS